MFLWVSAFFTWSWMEVVLTLNDAWGLTGNMKDENSSAYLDEVDRTFKILAERVQTARLKAES